MKVKITTENLGNEKYSLLAEFEGSTLDLHDIGLQKFYHTVIKGTQTVEQIVAKLTDRHPDCHFTKAEKNTTEADISLRGALDRRLNAELAKLEARYFIAPRNEWVSSQDFHQFYRPGNNDTDYKPGTPIERLRQAAFDTRRTGTAFFNLGELKSWQPDVELMFQAFEPSSKLGRLMQISVLVNELSMEVHKYEGNDGYIKPKLTIEEADKVANLFEQMADLIEPHWKKVEADYERQRGKENDSD